MNNNAKLEKIKTDIEEYINEIEKYQGNIHPKKVIARLNKIKEKQT